MRKDCNCEGWQKSWHQIMAAQKLAYNHRMEYTGDVVNYCPWCGQNLEEEMKKGRQVSSLIRRSSAK